MLGKLLLCNGVYAATECVIPVDFEANINHGRCVVPYTANHISENNFEGRREELVDLIMPSKMLKIDPYALAKTNILRLEIPASLEEVPSKCCFECPELTEVTYKPFLWRDTVSIGESAFENAKKLRVVALPKGITSIKERSFAGCNQLHTLVIPVTVERVDKDAFFGVRLDNLVITHLHAIPVAAAELLPEELINFIQNHNPKLSTQEQVRLIQDWKASTKMKNLLSKAGADLSECTICTRSGDYIVIRRNEKRDEYDEKQFNAVNKPSLEQQNAIMKQIKEQIEVGNRFETIKFILHRDNPSKLHQYIDLLLAREFTEAVALERGTQECSEIAELFSKIYSNTRAYDYQEASERSENIKKQIMTGEIKDIVSCRVDGPNEATFLQFTEDELKRKGKNTDADKERAKISYVIEQVAEKKADKHWANMSYIENLYLEKILECNLEESYADEIKAHASNSNYSRSVYKPSEEVFNIIMNKLYRIYQDLTLLNETVRKFEDKKRDELYAKGK